LEDDNFFCLLKEWETLEKFAKHRKSKYYKVLRGAMHLLKEPGEIVIYSCFHLPEQLLGDAIKTRQ